MLPGLFGVDVFSARRWIRVRMTGTRNRPGKRGRGRAGSRTETPDRLDPPSGTPQVWALVTEYRSTRLSATDSGPAYPPTAVHAVADVQATPERPLLVVEGFTVG